MTNKKIIKIALSVAIVHFIITSLVGHFIAVQIGTQMGQIVAGGLTEGSDKNPAKAEQEATRIYQNMKRKSEDINSQWKIPLFLISLPAKPGINYLLKDLRKERMKKAMAKEITMEQFKTQALITDYTANFLNSLSLGLLFFFGLKLSDKYRKRR